MDIDKIKRYNQKLLAVLGTILAIMAAIGLGMIIFFAVQELNQSLRFNQRNTGVLSDEKIEELQKDNKRQQLISYDMPRLVDTANLIYIIPVSHKTLGSPEQIPDGVLGMMDSFEPPRKIDSRYSVNIYGTFNNLLIYNLKEQTVHKLFEKRINFAEIRTEYVGEDMMILFKASNSDSFKDGVINQNDLKSLYVYSVNNHKLNEITLKDTDVTQYSLIPESQDLLIQFGIDKNEDGMYEDFHEPAILRRFDFETGKLHEIVGPEMNDLLQKKLEGSIK